MKINKFNIRWQIVRVRARKLKNPKDKIELVLKFLKANNNIYNLGRVLNWLKTTGMAYRGAIRERFNLLHDSLKASAKSFTKRDSDNDLAQVNTEDLQMVLDDLEKRKYNFQFKKTPADHIIFVNALRKELKSRKELGYNKS